MSKLFFGQHYLSKSRYLNLDQWFPPGCPGKVLGVPPIIEIDTFLVANFTRGAEKLFFNHARVPRAKKGWETLI